MRFWRAANPWLPNRPLLPTEIIHSNVAIRLRSGCAPPFTNPQAHTGTSHALLVPLPEISRRYGPILHCRGTRGMSRMYSADWIRAAEVRQVRPCSAGPPVQVTTALLNGSTECQCDPGPRPDLPSDVIFPAPL